MDLDFPRGGTLNFVGTSISAGSGASSADRAFPPQLCAILGMLPNNLAVSGSQSEDISSFLDSSFTTTSSTCSSLECAMNDLRLVGTTGWGLDNYAGSMMFDALHLLVPTASWTPVTDSSVVLAGTWSSAAGGALYTSSTPGDTATITFTGTTIYLMSAIAESTGSFQVAIDGVSQPPINQILQQATVNGQGFGFTCCRFVGLSSGSHTIVLTVSGGNCFVGRYFAFATPASLGPKLLLYSAWGVPNGQWGSAGSNDDTVRQYNAALKKLYLSILSDGHSIALVNARLRRDSEFNLTLSPPLIHPNDTGHLSLAVQGAQAALGIPLALDDIFGDLMGAVIGQGTAASSLPTLGSGPGQIQPNGNGSVPTTGASGSGAFAVSVHIADSIGSIIGAAVRISGAQAAGATTTDSTGNADFSLNSGSVTVSVSAPGYVGLVAAHTITTAGQWDATDSAELSLLLTAAGASLSPGAGQTTAYLTTRDGQGEPVAGVVLTITLVDPQAAADSFDLGTFTATSDNTGLLQVLLRKSSTYQARLAAGPWTTFTTGSASNFPLPEILGNYTD